MERKTIVDLVEGVEFTKKELESGLKLEYSSEYADLLIYKKDSDLYLITQKGDQDKYRLYMPIWKQKEKGCYKND